MMEEEERSVSCVMGVTKLSHTFDALLIEYQHGSVMLDYGSYSLPTPSLSR